MADSGAASRTQIIVAIVPGDERSDGRNRQGWAGCGLAKKLGTGCRLTRRFTLAVPGP
jgi:hypothetical protein